MAELAVQVDAVGARPAERAPMEQVVIAAGAALSWYMEQSGSRVAAAAACAQLHATGTTPASAMGLENDVLA